MTFTRDNRPVRATDILRGIYANRYWLIIGSILASGCAILWNKRYPPLYSSTVEIFVDEPYVSPDILANMSHLPAQGAKRAFHEASSSSMLEHLSQKFDLEGHYRISKKSSYGQQIIQQLLKSRMQVRLVDQNTLKVTIKDTNQDIAAMMAGETFVELKRRNDYRQALDVHNTHKLYQTVMKDIEENIKTNEGRMRTLLTSLSNAPIDHTVLGSDLLSIINAIDRNNEDHAQMSRTDQLITAMAGKEHLPRMILVQNATIDLESRPLIISLTRVGGTVLGSFLIMITFLIYYYKNRQQWVDSFHELFPGVIKSKAGPKTVSERQPYQRKAVIDEV
ncbi:MAG: hypothetical protein M3R08_03515 [Bacteroidota bacterium]|nr:hypothetical protein [Bacteroidota bacterium]